MNLRAEAEELLVMCLMGIHNLNSLKKDLPRKEKTLSPMMLSTEEKSAQMLKARVGHALRELAEAVEQDKKLPDIDVFQSSSATDLLYILRRK